MTVGTAQDLSSQAVSIPNDLLRDGDEFTRQRVQGLVSKSALGHEIGWLFRLSLISVQMEFVLPAVVGTRKQAPFSGAYMGRKSRGAAPSNAFAKRAKKTEKTVAKIKNPCTRSESIGRIRFRPMYARANMGHPSRTYACGWEILNLPPLK